MAVVVSDRADAGALRRAAAAGVATVSLPLADRRDPVVREAYDRRLAAVIGAFEPDLIVLAGWMLILGPRFLNTFPGRIVNVHPALLPDGDGVEVLTSHGRLPALRGPRTVRDALRQRLPATGATVHYVTSVVDCGPVILREEVAILPDDDEVGLHERIKSVEHRLLPRASRHGASGGFSVERGEVGVLMDRSGSTQGPDVIILLGSKSDMEHRAAIARGLDRFGVTHETRIASAHRVTRYLLDLVDSYERDGGLTSTSRSRAAPTRSRASSMPTRATLSSPARPTASASVAWISSPRCVCRAAWRPCSCWIRRPRRLRRRRSWPSQTPRCRSVFPPGKPAGARRRWSTIARLRAGDRCGATASVMEQVAPGLCLPSGP